MPENMNLTLKRINFSPFSTIGELSVDGKWECFTLEDCDRALENPANKKIPGETAIPRGRYQVVINHSSRFGRLMPRLLEVPQFEGILIHPGNLAVDTEGCILVGRVKGVDRILESRLAFDSLFTELNAATRWGKEIWIEIV